MTSFKKPTNAQIDAVVQRMRSPDFAAYFMARLENPLWIGALKTNGFFESPPPAIRQGRYVNYPHWPASKYLSRVAKDSPAEVSAIFAEIRTDNTSVVCDLLDAASVLPVKFAALLVPSVRYAAENGSLGIYFKEASDFCVALIEGGNSDLAFELTQAMFTPRFENGHFVANRTDQHLFGVGLKRIVPALAEAKSVEFLPLLCDWLRGAVSAKGHANQETGFDYSYIWRPAIESHEQNRNYDFAAVMVGFVRTAFEEAIRKEKITLQVALTILNRYAYLVFKRLKLHLANEFAVANREEARKQIMNRELFQSFEYKHEYAMLVGKHLDLLTPEERNEWFQWVEAGPDMSGFDESVRDREGREPTKQERQRRIDYWRFEKLHCVRKFLDADRRTFYERMLAEQGEPELADLNVRSSSGHWGSESPYTVEDLQRRTFADAAALVSTWQPKEPSHFGPNIEGLGSTFSNYVATSPTDFSTDAEQLVGKSSIFVRVFIERMNEAIKAAKEIRIDSVLKLCKWVVDRPVNERTIPFDTSESLVDENWQWTRNAISDFIETICNTKVDATNKYPVEDFRERIWELIESLCNDSSKSSIVRDITQEDPRVHDYLNMGITAPQGKAVETACAYGRWVSNQIKATDGTREVVPDGFGSISELREVLERLIAPGNRSFETLSVIGSQVGLIYWIDSKWLKDHASQLFDLEGIEKSPPLAQGWGAWNSFLVWTRPHIELYTIFESQYRYAVEQAAKVDLPERSDHQPMHDLGEHILLLYGRGQLELDGSDGLIRQFLKGVTSEIRCHAIGFVGRTLDSDGDAIAKIPDDVIKRFMKLWDEYWPDRGSDDAKRVSNALLFGTWFASGKFPQQWALDRLDEFTVVVPCPEPLDAVAEQLAEAAAVDPVKATQILDRMVRGDHEGWRVYGWLEPATAILKIALAHAEARPLAVTLINHLGRRGYSDFGALLE